MFESPQMREAFKRALVGAAIGAGLALFGALGTGADLRTIVAVTGLAFAGFAGWRQFGEGLPDARRDERGDVQASDVGAALIDEPVKYKVPRG